jgi:hypothetical protein
MLDHLLTPVLAHAHPLLLVCDPNDLFRSEIVSALFADAGYQILQEDDPVQLRHHYQEAQPVKLENRLLIAASSRLDHLPYDIWQQGHHLDLALHNLFPNLDYPILQQLQPGHLSRLAQVERLPDHPLSPNQTRDFLLREVFDAVPEQLMRPAGLLIWLDEYHSASEPMPPVLAEHLLATLRRSTMLDGWPLEGLLASNEVYRHFVQEEWGRYIQNQTREANEIYKVGIPFSMEPELQDALPRLLRTGTLTPVVVDNLDHLPQWTRSAVAVDEAGKQLRQIEAGLAALEESLSVEPVTWESWQTMARRWAGLNLIWYGANLYRPPSVSERWTETERQLDRHLALWLESHYTRLGSRTLPPHHLHHVLPFLAQRIHSNQRIAMLVLDGMALSDWMLIKSTWQERHPTWQMDEQLLLAQVPSITSVSRQALIGGRRPAHFSTSLTHNRYDAQGWRTFWRNQELPENAIHHAFLADRLGITGPDTLDSRHTRALCLVSTAIDEMIHGATQGAGDVLASLRLWLNEGSHGLEEIINRLLVHEYKIVIATDHGHVAAIGMGQPQEGVTVESRSKRARLYNNADFAQTVHRQYPHTVMWHNDSLLPDEWWVLMPQGRYAFAPQGQQVVSHGGLTIDEMIVPLVIISC